MEEQKLGRIQKSWLLTRSAWRALKADTELLWIPVISTVVSLFIIAGVVITLAFGGAIGVTEQGGLSPLGYALLIAIGIALGVVSAFSSGAIIYGALDRFRGNDPTVRGSLEAAAQRIGSLSLFAIFSGAIGYVISEIASRIPGIGGLVVNWLGNAAWAVASFFAIPVIVSKNTPTSPISATKESVGLLQKTWGESLIISATIGFVSFVAAVLYVLATGIVFGVVNLVAVPVAVNIVIAVAAFLGLVGFVLIFSALEGFVKAALYYYAVTGESPASFDANILRQTFTQKRARKIFGA